MDVHTVTYSAPGKIIFFGEHAVVYGYPAIVMAIDLRAYCMVSSSSQHKTQLFLPNINSNKRFNYNEKIQSFANKNNNEAKSPLSIFDFIIKTLLSKSTHGKNLSIEINSKIPMGVGLGSSAAIAVSTIASISSFIDLKFTLEDINHTAYESEKITHGKPSGIDNTISTFGGIHLFQEKKFEKIVAGKSIPHMVITNSGILRNTKDYVERVANYKKKEPKRSSYIFQTIGDIVEEAKSCFSKPNEEKLGKLMNENQKLLEELGIGHPLLSKLIKIAEKNNALGSKLTGAGGGGCIISLFENDNDVKKAIKEINGKGFQAFSIEYSEIGVNRE